MAVTETTTESWGSRLGSSIKGVLIGAALFIAGFPVLFWNEGNSVKTARAIDEGAKCRGYHYWGAIDCWSWNNAFKNRYGFVEVDLAHNYQRVPKESSDWIRQVATTHIVD